MPIMLHYVNNHWVPVGSIQTQTCIKYGTWRSQSISRHSVDHKFTHEFLQVYMIKNILHCFCGPDKAIKLANKIKRKLATLWEITLVGYDTKQTDGQPQATHMITWQDGTMYNALFITSLYGSFGCQLCLFIDWFYHCLKFNTHGYGIFCIVLHCTFEHGSQYVKYLMCHYKMYLIRRQSRSGSLHIGKNVKSFAFASQKCGYVHLV